MAHLSTDEQYFSRNHPILSLILHDEPPAVDVSVLGDFVDYALDHDGRGIVPRTLTEFYADYLSFRIARFLQRDRGRFAQRHFLWDIDGAMDRLGKLAYLSKIRAMRLTRSAMVRILCPGKDKGREVQWELESLGLLEEVKEMKERKTGGMANGDVYSPSSTKLNGLAFIEDEDEEENDYSYDVDDEEDDDDDDDDDEGVDESAEQVATKEKPKFGRWWALAGRRKSKTETEIHCETKTTEQVSMETAGKKRVAQNRGRRNRLTSDARGGSRKNETFRFKERGIEEFLVARHHFRQCKRKCSVNGITLTSSMRRSARKLPTTGDIWRMAFGLMGRSNQTSALVKDIVVEVIEECKLRQQMTPLEVTSLCVEAVYESGNTSGLAEILEEFTLNQTINYSNCDLPRHRVPYAVSAVGYLVRASRNIYGIHMAYFRLDEDTIEMLADPINATSDNYVQVLNLSGNYDLGARAVKRLLRFLVKANHLTHLDLSGCRIGDQGLHLLSEFFECFPLQFLRVSSNSISDVGVPSMSRNFHYVPTLEWLDLSDNQISDRSAAILASALSSLPQLRSLDLRRNLLGNFGADVLTRSLEGLRRITSLILAENRIGESGASALARNLWKTKSLRYVNISLNNIPSSGIVGLRKAASSRGSIHVNAEVQQIQRWSTASSYERVYLVGEEEEELEKEEEEEVEEDGESQRKGWKSMVDVWRSVDLLVGRHDEAPVEERKKRLRPRRGPLSRSWHELNGSFRSSFRRSKRKGDE